MLTPVAPPTLAMHGSEHAPNAAASVTSPEGSGHTHRNCVHAAVLHCSNADGRSLSLHWLHDTSPPWRRDAHRTVRLRVPPPHSRLHSLHSVVTQDASALADVVTKEDAGTDLETVGDAVTLAVQLSESVGLALALQEPLSDDVELALLLSLTDADELALLLKVVDDVELALLLSLTDDVVLALLPTLNDDVGLLVLLMLNDAVGLALLLMLAEEL